MLPQIALKRAASVLLWTAIATVPARASLTFITDPGAGTGAERCLSDGAGNGGTCANQGTYANLTSMVQLFADSQGMTLTRIDDGSDQFWTAQAGSGVFGLARSAGRDFTLGLIPGATGGSYTQLLGVIGSSSGPKEFLPGPPANSADSGPGDLDTSGSNYDVNKHPVFTAIPIADQGSPFRFAIKQNTATNPDLWASNPVDNRDTADHMVTWQLHSAYLDSNNLVWYVAGFENAVFPTSDGDFNDYAFVFQNVTNQQATPEPASFAIAGAALAGLFAWRYRVRRTRCDAAILRLDEFSRQPGE